MFRGFPTSFRGFRTLFRGFPTLFRSFSALFRGFLILSREILAVRVEGDVHTDVGFRIRGSVFPFLDGFHGTVGENGIATHY